MMRIKIAILIVLIALVSSCHRNQHLTVQGYVEGENIYLSSPYSGILKNIKVQRGQHVERNQELFQLDPNPQAYTIAQTQSELAQAKSTLADLIKPRRNPEIAAIEAQIEQAKSQIALAKVRVDRFDKLYKRQATDKDTLDAAIANLQQQQDLKAQYEANLALAKLGSRDDQIKAQQAIVDSLTAKLAQAKWELAQKTLAAPASGVIFDTYYRQGEFVPNQQAVLSLLTPENTRIEFFIPLNALAKIHLGQEVVFNCEGCNKDNIAVINYISPDAEYIPPLVYSRENAAKLVFRIKAHIKNSNLFKPGQPVMVTL
jgi:HlyD family secretion protein